MKPRTPIRGAKPRNAPPANAKIQLVEAKPSRIRVTHSINLKTACLSLGAKMVTVDTRLSNRERAQIMVSQAPKLEGGRYHGLDPEKIDLTLLIGHLGREGELILTSISLDDVGQLMRALLTAYNEAARARIGIPKDESLNTDLPASTS